MKQLRFSEAQIVQILGQAASSESTITEVCRLHDIGGLSTAAS
jgi:hypothetical protein